MRALAASFLSSTIQGDLSEQVPVEQVDNNLGDKLEAWKNKDEREEPPKARCGTSQKEYPILVQCQERRLQEVEEALWDQKATLDFKKTVLGTHTRKRYDLVLIHLYYQRGILLDR